MRGCVPFFYINKEGGKKSETKWGGENKTKVKSHGSNWYKFEPYDYYSCISIKLCNINHLSPSS